MTHKTIKSIQDKVVKVLNDHGYNVEVTVTDTRIGIIGTDFTSTTDEMAVIKYAMDVNRVLRDHGLLEPSRCQKGGAVWDGVQTWWPLIYTRSK
jgi:hypothetical protein